jgi:LPS-assembly lipoprotein
LIAAQDVELSREYTYDQNASAGSPAEQELIQKELRRDMEAAILRRLDVALRQQP